MLILSQDKKLLANMNNIVYLEARDDGAIYFYTDDSSASFVGQYKSEERAKEVLKELYCWYTRRWH